ncbi:MAG TPA: hypothetical protein VFG68_10660 [Fimbriiglobus sp.]|nr:hypothetical protein [Fimbriiglobus sp.]
MVRQKIMGRVTVEAKVENAGDLWAVAQGLRKPEEVRSIQVTDALVDTGCTLLCLPTGMIRQLGFDRPIRTRTAKTTRGDDQSNVYGPVRLTVNGRDCSVDVAEIDDACPVLIGQVPLELLDFVVDLTNQRLVGNPAHGGEAMIEMY